MSPAGFVTVALTVPVAPANRQRVLDLYDRIAVLEKSMTVPGAIDTWIAEPAGADDALTVFTRWENAHGYEAWNADPRRDEILEHLLPLLDGHLSSVTYQPTTPAAAARPPMEAPAVPNFAVRYTFADGSAPGRQETLSEHVAWLGTGLAQGFIVSSGAWADGTGALILVRHAGKADTVRERMHGDPFYQLGFIDTVQVDAWHPALGTFA